MHIHTTLSEDTLIFAVRSNLYSFGFRKSEHLWVIAMVTKMKGGMQSTIDSFSNVLVSKCHIDWARRLTNGIMLAQVYSQKLYFKDGCQKLCDWIRIIY